MNQERFWVLFSKKITNEANLSELEEFEKIILENPEWQYAVQNFCDIWDQKQPENYIEAEDAFLIHMNRINEGQILFGVPQNGLPEISNYRKKIKWYWAAAILFGLLVSLVAFKIFEGKSSNQLLAKEINEISTRPGSRSKVKLPDGSTVCLNAGSQLTYNKEYGKELREVTLIGEGFFDVMKNKEVPFIIHTSSINIKVLGTVFNVKAYPQDKLTETSLIRGSIEVTIKNRPNNKIILSPNEKLIVKNDELIDNGKTENKNGIIPPLSINTLVSITKLKYSPIDSTVTETAWIDNKLVFRDESFEDLAVQMGRWYDVSIEINDPVLKQTRLNGTFQSETVFQALDALKESIPFRYQQTGNKIIIHR